MTVTLAVQINSNTGTSSDGNILRKHMCTPIQKSNLGPKMFFIYFWDYIVLS